MKDKIENALVEHGLWKLRLREAIKRGRIEAPVATIEMDDQCALGKWLHGSTITPEVRDSAHYKKAKELHAEFHKAAARVGRLAITGGKDEAEQLMQLGGEYVIVSSKFTAAMLEWKKSLKQQSGANSSNEN